MRKLIFTLLAILITNVVATAQDIYGWLRYDERNYENYGICVFNADSPGTVTVKFPFDYDKQACAGAFADGKYYVYRYSPSIFGDATPLDFGTVDLNTGEFTRIADYAGLNALFADMTYDYTTSTMYAIGNPNGGNVTVLMKVNLSDGEIEQVATFDVQFVTLACSYGGQLYAIKADDGFLYSIDKTTGEIAEIGYTYEEPAEYVQSMEFDHNTGTLFWAGNNTREEGFLAVIDITTGESNRKGNIGNNAQIVGLHIPFEKVNNEAPAAVTDLNVTVATDGSLSATLSWVNPTTTSVGEPLSEITKVEIYRNEVLVGEVTNATAGEQSTYTDSSLDKAGLVTYRVAAVNSAGNGKSSESIVFVGFDVPAAPANATVEKLNDKDIKISWEAPSAGLNGGNIDNASLQYKITRLPDNTVVCEATAETSFTDSSITTMASYSYTIEAFTAAGTGGNVTTGNITAGPALTVPYFCDFASEADFALWNVEDANEDGYTWRRETTLDAAYYLYNDWDYIGGDDWLISSPIKLEAGKTYRLSFKSQSYGESFPEKVSVHFGTSASSDAMTTMLGDYEVISSEFMPHEVILPAIAADGNYHIGFRCHSDPDMYVLYITDINLEEVIKGEVSGIVTDGTNPIAGATVSIKGSETTTTTDAEGKFTFNDIDPGTYTLVCTAEGYAKTEREITVESEKTTADITMKALKAINITGTIVNAASQPVNEAKVTVNAYTTQSVTTADDGKFSIQGVMVADNAQLLVSRYELKDHTQAIDTENSEIDLGNIVLLDKILSPYNLKVAATDDAATISWEAPIDLTEYRHDSGNYNGRIGTTGDTDKSVYGSIFRTPAQLRSMTWYTDKYLQEHHAVNIYVFDLDENGNPTSTILYSETGVANIDNTWMTRIFAQPVDAPRGYMLAISSTTGGHTGLGLAEVSDEYPFNEGTHCYAEDYTTGSFTFTEEHDITRPMMIRANGMSLTDAQLPSITEKKYEVYRFAEADNGNTDAWVKLTSEPQAELTYTDTLWATIEKGMYGYAVTAVYSSDTSIPTISETVANKLSTNVEITVTTNTPQNESEGAIVTLKAENGDTGHIYTATIDVNGKATINNVWKDTYTIEIIKHGYNTITATGVALTDEPTYALSYQLNEYVVEPYNLEISAGDRADSRLFTWNEGNFLFDDFEGHPDFEINSPGEIGWQYIDGDQDSTYPISGCEYRNMVEPMAFMIFNPYETDPALNVTVPASLPYSGEKYLGGFGNYSYENDDYFISPELSFTQDFTFKFFAKSLNDQYGLESINVGYSLTDATAESFTWINGDTPIELPKEEWTEYKYTIPADAKYVAINYVSYCCVLAMIDDVFVGIELPEGVDPDAIRNDISFEVYLDGNKVTDTTENSYLFTELDGGTHRAGVKAVFASTTTPLIETEFYVEGDSSIGLIDGDNNGNIVVYPNPTSGLLNVKGEYENVEIINIAGMTVARFENGETIDISNQANGVYFARISSNGIIYTEKVILSK